MSATELIKQLQDVKPEGLGEEERKGLMAACDQAKSTLENPFEAGIRICFAGHETFALRLGIDMGLFDAGVEKGGEISTAELAAKTGADSLLVTRIMRLLVGINFFKETGPDTYLALPVAGAYVSTAPLAAAAIHITDLAEVVGRMPTYFAERGFRNPENATDAPFQFTWGTDKHYFDWLQSKPRNQAAFNTTMGIQRKNRGEDWFDFYPVTEKLVVSDPSSTVLVDVGGGLGHDLIALKEKFPALQGKLVVQDIPVVIDDVKDLPAGVEAMGYDFFQPQPVKGAKAYYLRTVLHDWPDKEALQILSIVKSAMAPDSVLLINENALPETNVPLHPAKLDLSMMALFASLDRTGSQFESLLDRAGFNVVKVWKPAEVVPGSGTLFEAVLKS